MKQQDADILRDMAETLARKEELCGDLCNEARIYRENLERVEAERDQLKEKLEFVRAKLHEIGQGI